MTATTHKWKFEKAPATGNCWYCQKKGHMKCDCRKWKFEKARASGSCWYCQKKGHMKRDCRKWKYEKAGETKNKRGHGDAVFRRSHKPCTRPEEKKDHSNECRVQRTKLKPDERSNRSPEDLQREHRNDPSLGNIINWLEASPIRPSWREVSPQSLEVKSYWRLWESLSIQDGVLTYRWETANRDVGISLRVLPRCMRWDAWSQLHEDPGGGHLGISKTLGKLRERFFWTGQSLDINKWCEACNTCSAKKGPARKPRSTTAAVQRGLPWRTGGRRRSGAATRNNCWQSVPALRHGLHISRNFYGNFNTRSSKVRSSGQVKWHNYTFLHFESTSFH